MDARQQRSDDATPFSDTTDPWHIPSMQVVNLHYMLSRASVKARPSVLWCYKKDLGFTTCVRARRAG